MNLGNILEDDTNLSPKIEDKRVKLFYELYNLVSKFSKHEDFEKIYTIISSLILNF